MRDQDKFIWTDELVKQYANYLFAFGTPADEKISKFKEIINRQS